VVTSPLHANGQVVAQQIGCEGTDHEIPGPLSDPPVPVHPAPSPVPQPAFHEPSLIPGNDVVTLTALLVGAEIEVKSGGVTLATGLATAESNWVPLSAKLTGDPVFATQALCGNVSTPVEATPKGKLATPEVLGPVCPDARHVVVRNTTVNATVVVLRNGGPVGYGGAGPGDVVIQLGAGITLQPGQQISAVQYLGSAVSFSNTVPVIGGLEQPAVEILGGHPFFTARPGEQPIGGPVFPRGAGAGPQIRIQTCCEGEVRLHILDPRGEVVAQPAVSEVYPGYYAASWPWASYNSVGVQTLPALPCSG
jgi:hypothetical protein